MEETQIKLLLMNQRSEYLIGKVTELDEEPSILIEGCYEVTGEDTLSPFPKYSSQPVSYTHLTLPTTPNV